MTNVTLNNGVEMPALGLGVFQTPPEETRAAVGPRWRPGASRCRCRPGPGLRVARSTPGS